MRRRIPTRPKAALLFLLAVGCISIFGFSAFAQQAQLVIDTSESFGTFDNVEYIVYQGRFTGTAGGETFSAPFEIVAPADPSQGNGRVVLEPFHPSLNHLAGEGMGGPLGPATSVHGPIVRNRFLGKAFLFGHGFSHAGICLQKDDRACEGFVGAPEMLAGMGFIVSFAQALKAGQAAKMVGDIEYLYSVGFAASADPLDDLLQGPLGQGLFDLSLLISNGWSYGLVRLPETPEIPVPAGAGRVMVLLSESDVVRYGTLLRDDVTQPHYRSYEVAGGPQVSAGRPSSLRGVTGVDWTPVLRALFVAGDRWVSEGIEPPPSTSLDEVVAGEIDPLHTFDYGIAIARDANLNAVGGVRVPYLELGQGQFVAIEGRDRFNLAGTFLDLACEPLADGGVRFADHEAYVEQFVAETERLMGEGFLLQDDADVMIEWAAGNEIGMPGSCP